MKQIHFFYFFQRVGEVLTPMIIQVIVEHDEADFDGAGVARDLAAADNALDISQLMPLCVISVPDIRLLQFHGDLQQVFSLGTHPHPAVTVYDLDLGEGDAEVAATRLRSMLEQQGYASVPFQTLQP